jgi:O-antigen ligase
MEFSTEGALVNEKLNSWKLGAISLLVALMPLSFSVSWRGKALPAALLALVGLGLLASRTATWRSYRNAWPVIAVSALGLLCAALNIVDHGLGWRQFDTPSHVLLFLVTAAVFSLPLRMRWLWLGFSLTAIFLGGVCIVQRDLLGAARAYGLNGGPWGAIEFGMIMLALSLMAWVQTLFSTGSLLERAVHGAGAVMGMYGAMLTESRGPLLAFVPMLMTLLLIYAYRTRRWRRTLLIAAAVIGGGILAGVSVHGAVMGRFTKVGPEVASYDHHTDARGAVRERLEMWRTAHRAFLTHPLTGVGLDQFGVYVRQQVAAGHTNSAIMKYDHPHNEYLEAAATGGVPGLLVLLLIFGVPLGFFVRHVRHPELAVATAACAGLAIVGMYVLCAVTDNVFYRPMPHSYYFFLVLGLAVLIGQLTAAGPDARRV